MVRWSDPTVVDTVQKLLQERSEILRQYSEEKEADVEGKLKDFDRVIWCDKDGQDAVNALYDLFKR